MNFPGINKLSKSKTVVSLEIVFGEGNSIKEIRSGFFSYSLSGKFKEVIPLSKQVNIEEVIEKHGVDSAYVITFSGKGVITKKIPEYKSDLDIVSQAIPNLSIDDYYFYTLSDKIGIWISLTSRREIDDILKQFKGFKTRVVQCFFWALIFAPTSVYIFCINLMRFLTPEYEVDTDAQGGFSFQPNTLGEQSTIKILDKTYSGSYLLSMVGALSYLVGTCSPYNPTSAFVIASREEEKYKNLFNRFLFGGVTLLFVLAFGSFALNGYLSQRYNDIMALQSDRSEIEQEIVSINAEIDSKEEFLSSVGLTSNTSYSFYMDRLAKSVPRTITLVEMEVNPIQEKLKSGKPIQVEKNVIRVSGIVGKDEILSNWVLELSKMDWIRLVEITDYMPVARSENHQFNIKIEL